MKHMKLIRLILCEICFVCFFFYNSFLLLADENANITYYTDAKEIKSEVSKRGANIVVSEIYSHYKAWAYVLRNIATGTECWLRVAVALHSGADAAAREMLGFSVGEALENAPHDVFRIALPEFQLESICSAPDIDDVRYNSFDLVIKVIKQRQKSISTISDPKLKNVCKQCIQLLEESKSGVANFYGIRNIKKYQEDE